MLDLRFVEVEGDRKEVQLIQKFPATIGKSRDRRIPPPYHTSTLIETPLVSGFHCTVTFDLVTDVWTVTDGVGGVRSTNGLYGQVGGEFIGLGAGFVLRDAGDRVYLLNTTDGRQAYLEVFNVSSIDEARSTQGLEPALIKLREEVDLKISEGVERGKVRDQRLDEVSEKIQALEVAGQVLIGIDRNKGAMIRGAFTSAIVSLLCVPMFLLFIAIWNNGELAKALLDLLPHGTHEERQN